MDTQVDKMRWRRAAWPLSWSVFHRLVPRFHADQDSGSPSDDCRILRPV